MKTIGLIGGISWVSTIEYYRYINQLTNEKLGGNNFSKCIIHSLNFGEVMKKNKSNDTEGLYHLIRDAALSLQKSGAHLLALCANTMHMLADRLQQEIEIPLIHIAEATAKEIQTENLKKVALLGTKPTMELNFYRDKLSSFNIDTIIPVEEQRNFIHNSIFEELGKGMIKEATKAKYLSIIEDVSAKGAEGVILGCTEIPLIIKQKDSLLPVFDTTYIHSKAIVDFALR